MRSIYRWQGKIEDDSEVLWSSRQRKSLFDKLAKRVKELHSYTVPEIIALPVIAGSEDLSEMAGDETETINGL